MTSDPHRTIITYPEASECARCGALVTSTGVARHEAWHEFIESSLAGFAADLAALGPD